MHFSYYISVLLTISLMALIFFFLRSIFLYYFLIKKNSKAEIKLFKKSDYVNSLSVDQYRLLKKVKKS